MNDELEQRLDAVCESLDVQKAEFEAAAKCCVEAIQGMNHRLERVEKWMLEKNRLKLEKIKALS